MKRLNIQYLLMTADLVGGTEQAIIHQANALARRGHTVSIISVFRDADRPHFHIHPKVQVTYAIDRRDDRIRPHRSVAGQIPDPVWLQKQGSAISPPVGMYSSRLCAISFCLRYCDALGPRSSLHPPRRLSRTRLSSARRRPLSSRSIGRRPSAPEEPSTRSTSSAIGSTRSYLSPSVRRRG